MVRIKLTHLLSSIVLTRRIESKYILVKVMNLKGYPILLSSFYSLATRQRHRTYQRINELKQSLPLLNVLINLNDFFFPQNRLTSISWLLFNRIRAFIFCTDSSITNIFSSTDIFNGFVDACQKCAKTLRLLRSAIEELQLLNFHTRKLFQKCI